MMGFEGGAAPAPETRAIAPALCMALLAMLAGCAAQGRAGDERLRPVAGSDLAVLLSNAGVERTPSRVPGAIEIRVPFGEYFEADGSYTLRVEHAVVRGTYTIRGPSLCVEVPGQTTRCRRIFRNPRGLYFTSYDDSPGRLAEITVRH
jgi:hypothetical protein